MNAQSFFDHVTYGIPLRKPKTPYAQKKRQLLVMFLVTVFLMADTEVFALRQERPLTFQRFNTEQGLAQNWVYAVVQDRQGFMWVGTEDGLNRYDGYSFKTYKSRPFDSTSLSQNTVLALLCDSRGFLWVGTFGGGVSRYDPETDSFTQFRSEPEDPSTLDDNHVNSLFLDRRGNVWVTTSTGLNRYDPSTGRFTRFRHPVVTVLFSLAEDEQGNLWIGSNNGLLRFDPSTERWQLYQNNPRDRKSLPHNYIFVVKRDRRGVFWLGTRGGLVRFSPSTMEFVRISLLPTNPAVHYPVGAISEGKDDRLWVGTRDGGLFLLDSSRSVVQHYRHDPIDPTSLANDRVSALYEDSTEVLWVGLQNGGLMKSERAKLKFRWLRHDPKAPNSLSHPIATRITQADSERIWIATFGGGLNRYHRRTGTFEHFVGGSHAGALSANHLLTVAQDRNGFVYCGGMSGMLDVGKNGRFRQYPLPQQNERGLRDLVSFVFEDSRGVLWIGTAMGGLTTFDRATNRFGSFLLPAGLSQQYINSMIEDRRGWIWVATMGRGVGIIVPGERTVRMIARMPGEKAGLVTNEVQVLHEDREGNIWIGTRAGLQRYEPLSGQFLTVTENEGLPSSTIYGILEDQKGTLWVSTGSGIAAVNKDGSVIRSYDLHDGIQGLEFTQQSYWSSPEGYLYFGGGQGITWFHPDSLETNSTPPPLVVTEVRIVNRSLPTNNALLRQGLTLLHSENFLSITYAALDFRVPSKNRYRYILEGFDERWVEAGTQRQAVYTNIPPGSYRFVVTGANNDGVWNEQGFSFSITILPPWWSSWWFRSIAVFAVVALLYAGYRIQLRGALREERLRTKIARDLHDDLSGTLSSITFYSDAVKRGGERSGKYLEQIAESAREAKEKMSDIIWSVDPRHDDWNEFLSRCERYAADLLESRGIQYELTIDKNVPGQLHLELRQHLWLIFKELIVNLVRHSGASRANVTMNVFQKTLVLTVSDDGQGFNPQAAHPGHGLNNVWKRVELLKGQAAVESLPGSGTRWRIQVPL
jgi:ligand-binding sensor domain-containing protein/signal transduction histidine kinase